jgi:hypothetical protein
MANKYWVTGGTGNWNSTTNWSLLSGGVSGAPVPSTIDAVILDASSGAGSVTLDISPDIQKLTCTGFTGTLAFGANTISLNDVGTIFTGATTMTVTGTPQIICTSTTAVSLRTITPTAVTEANSISFRVTAGTAGLSLTAGAFCNLDFTDGTNPTGYAGALGNTVLTIYGNFKASTGMTRTAGTSGYTFAATSGTKTIITANVVFDCPFTFNGVGGTWQLQDALTSGATRICTVSNGTLDLNGYTLTTGLFSSTNSNTRTLAFGAGKIVVTGVNVTIFNIGTSTGMTVSGTNPLVEATGAGTGGQTRGVAMGRTFSTPEAYSISLTVNAGADLISFSGAGAAFRNVSFVGFTGTFTIAQAQVVYGNWNFGGVTGMTGTSSITFGATSGTKTITSNSVTFSNAISISGIGGTFACQDALFVTGALTMTNGTLQLKAGTTNTVGSFVTSGTNGKYLLSTTFGTAATISQASGTVTVDYLTVQDSIATGGAVFDALAITNVDAGNNTGWLFSTTPSIGNEITMRLRSFTQPRRF